MYEKIIKTTYKWTEESSISVVWKKVNLLAFFFIRIPVIETWVIKYKFENKNKKFWWFWHIMITTEETKEEN